MTTHPLRFGLVAGIHADWDDLVRRAREIESLGFDAAWVTDHFFGGSDEMTITHEAYSVLVGLAMATSRVRLGVMVAGNTYRNPIVLLKQAITVDHISNGRVDFGIGAGWWDREHEAYSYYFPTARERVDMFEESVTAIDMLQRQERTTFEGKHYQYINAPCVPKPVQQPRMPMLIGAGGNRMLGITARQADIWNTRSELEEAKQKSALLDKKCQEIGRDPDEILRSVWPFPSQLGSVETFTSFVESFYEAGFRDFLFGWPANEQEHEVLQTVARDVIPSMRAEL